MNFEEELAVRQKKIEEIICLYMPREEGYHKLVVEAMNYSIRSGGKRIRPLLMVETYRLFGGNGAVIEPFMAALEMIHTYSLVHDDLPSMDNDEYRRGRKTTHTVYGEGIAILAGDALLNYAFETACRAFAETDTAAEMRRVADALAVLGEKSGIHGMIGGQCADILAEEEGAGITTEWLLYIHENKTAALMQSAMMIGAILGGGDQNEIAAMEKAAYNIGMAFQIQDDILDVEGSFEELGKLIGSDEKNNKLTYVRLNGMEAAKAMVEKLSLEAADILTKTASARNLPPNEFLDQLVQSMISRKK